MKNSNPGRNRQHARHKGRPLVLHGPCNDFVVVPLHVVQRSELARRDRIFLLMVLESFADEEAGQQRRQQHGHKVGSAQRDGHGNRQRANELAYAAGNQQQRHKRRDDGQRRGQHGNGHLRGAPLCRLVDRHFPVQQPHIVVDNYDGIVHHHAQHYNQRRDRHLLQLDATGVQHAEGHGHRDRNGNRRHQRHTQRQQQHGHQDDGDDGNPELLKKIADAFGNHARLVRHQVQFHVRRQSRLNTLQRGAQGIAEVHDVVALVHLHRQQNRLLAVEARIFGGVLVHPLYIGQIADGYRLAGRRDIDHKMANLVFGLECPAGFNRHLTLLGRHAAGILHCVASLQRLHHSQRIHGILREPFR